MFMNLNEERRMKRDKLLEDKKELEEKEKIEKEKEEESMNFVSNIINWKFFLFIVLLLVLYMAMYYKYGDTEENNTFYSYVPVINVVGLIFFFIILFTL